MFSNTCRACAATSSPPTSAPCAVDTDEAGDEEEPAGHDGVRVVRDRLGKPFDPVLAAFHRPDLAAR